MEISIKPILTEKATKLTEKLNVYTFAVSPDATKGQIRNVIENLYGVKVVRVNTAVMRAKTNRAGQRAVFSAARQPSGRRPSSLLPTAKPSTF